MFRKTYLWYLRMLADYEDISSVVAYSNVSAPRPSVRRDIVPEELEEMSPTLELAEYLVPLEGGQTNWEAWEPYSIPAGTYQVVSEARRFAHKAHDDMMKYEREVEFLWKIRRLAGR